MDNEAVTAPLGVILLMPSLLLAAMAGVVMFNNMAEWSNAEGDRAQFYAECAYAQITEGVEPHPECPSHEWDRPGWDCVVKETTVECYATNEDGGTSA